MPKKAVIIFSGYNQRAIISFCRVAEKQNIPLVIIAKSESDSIFDTKYARYVKYIRKKLDLDLSYFKYILNYIKSSEDFDEYIILPSSEALNRFLLKNRDELESLNFMVPLVDEQTYNLISNKYNFGELCKKNGIKVPEEFRVDDINSFPVVIKPKSYYTSDGRVIAPQIIKDMNALMDFITQNNLEDFYIQEYVEGESYYLLYYFSKDGSYQSFSQKNILQQSRGKSIIAAISAEIHKENISNKFIELFKSVEFTGLVMVEIRLCKGEYYMIEANPRLWGPSQLFVDSDCCFFELYLKDMGFNVNMNTSCNTKDNVRYFWLGGLIESLYKYGEIAFHIDNHDLFMKDFRAYLSNEIYLREDTQNLFVKEILGLLEGD